MQTITRRSWFSLCFGSAAASVAASSLSPQAAPASEFIPKEWHPTSPSTVTLEYTYDGKPWTTYVDYVWHESGVDADGRAYSRVRT